MTEKAIWLGFALRVAIAFWNGFLGPSYGAEADAESLHEMAISYGRGELPDLRLHYAYAYVLGTVYRLTVDSLFLGSLVSCIAWFISARALAAAMNLLHVRRSSRSTAMLIYALLPSAALWTAVTLREPFQLLFVNLAIYAALQVGVKRGHGYLALLLLACACGSFLHAAIFGWGILLVAVTIGWQLVGSSTSERFRIVAMVLSVPALAVTLWLGYSMFRGTYNYSLDKGIAGAVETYQQGGLTARVRTDYRSDVSIKNLVDLAAFIPVALVQYLFEPFPWRVSSPADLAPLLENILRALLVTQAVFSLLKLRGPPLTSALIVFSFYLVLEVAWAMGTFNWGTASRHHIPGLGLLLLAAFAYPRRPAEGGGAVDLPPGRPRVIAA